MQSQYDSWQKASHHTVATCNDCHLPHGFVAKYLAKAENGYNHSRGFTLQDFPEPIRITEKNADILQENCLYCHEQIVHGLVRSATVADDAVHCIHCHRDVGHGEQVGLGGPSELFTRTDGTGVAPRATAPRETRSRGAGPADAPARPGGIDE